MAAGKVYSFEEVRPHADRKDCWLIINGKVYDVTAFMEEHPGGDEVLLACIGKDATADYENIGHSESAKEQMAQYCIGEFDAATMPAKPVKVEDFPAPSASSPGVWRTVLQLAVPLLLVTMAFGFQNFANTETE
ncbi:cytochrome B5-like [Lolium rigidum]|uniref:cytochrome B5-like n=1 Tax=Lolium rigidum TaxID=89674 RepID=UPI001F5CD8CA|nr:cytochrome B5-like [Lolium rigidum]